MSLTIGIVAKPVPQALELAVELRGWLRSRRARVLWSETTAAHVARARPSPAAALQKADLMITLGGDGTLLYAAGLLAGARVPIIGVNLGFLGFLTEIAQARLYPVLEDALAGRSETDERMLIRVELLRDGKRLHSGLVLNDAVIAKGALARILELSCAIDRREVATYRADGIIIATPTGSTAYNLSAGGPIVYPTMKGMIVVPICPHTLSQRPLVVGGDSEIRLSVLPGGDNLYLTLDGQRGRPLRDHDEVVCTQGGKSVYLVRDPDVHFFRVLREKLGWGG